MCFIVLTFQRLRNIWRGGSHACETHNVVDSKAHVLSNSWRCGIVHLPLPKWSSTWLQSVFSHCTLYSRIFLVYSSWIFKKTQWNIEAIWGWRRKCIKRNYSNIKFAIVKAVAVYYHLLHLQQVTEDCLFFVGKEWNPTPWSNVVHLFIAWHCRLDCSIYYWMSSKWGITTNFSCLVQTDHLLSWVS